jgi:hypothetical protein
MDIRAVCIVLLAPALLFSKAAHISAKANAYIHTAVKSLV